jgi:hypothetical protein
MKLIFENWRNYVLTEAMKQPEDLPEDLFIGFAENKNSARFRYITADGNYSGESDRNAAIHGEVIIRIGLAGSEGSDTCSDIWTVGWSAAAHGWGPMLYDCAIEYSTLHGHGLMPDRASVSSEAAAIWNYYYNKRGDVEKIQMDDIEISPEDDKYTPNYSKDDCDQDVARDYKDKYPNWLENPITSAYRKKPTTLNKLKELGKLKSIKWEL